MIKQLSCRSNCHNNKKNNSNASSSLLLLFFFITIATTTVGAFSSNPISTMKRSTTPKTTTTMMDSVRLDFRDFGKDKEWFKAVEIKHGRLAMVVAATVILSETFAAMNFHGGLETVVSDIQNESNQLLWLLNNEDINSVMKDLQKVPELWGFCFGLTAVLDLYGIRKAEIEGPDYIPGNVGFDPLNLYPTEPQNQKYMQSFESLNGRVAMFAVSYFVINENELFQ